MNELSTIIIYHDTYTEAVGHAIDHSGLDFDSGYLFDQVGLSFRRPSDGETTRLTLESKDNKFLHIQVYNRETEANTYELNCYQL